MFIEIPIIGTGTQRDPYRPKLPVGVTYSAYIPTGKDGRPVFSKCLVCVPDALPVPKDATVYAKQDAILSIKSRDTTLDTTKLKVSGAA